MDVLHGVFYFSIGLTVPVGPRERLRDVNSGRTSVQMIENHYAKRLSPCLTKGLNVIRFEKGIELGR